MRPDESEPWLFVSDGHQVEGEAVEAVCAICGRELWSDGLPPSTDGDAWICGDCDQARNFQSLDL
jgi:hypothetical protein